ncbi:MULTISPECIES: hypothetical protein [Vibrio]|uniref:hypothetical protein n=1 Tax=Vibrio TaxID=662 RepID=UPI003AB3EA6D
MNLFVTKVFFSRLFCTFFAYAKRLRELFCNRLVRIRAIATPVVKIPRVFAQQTTGSPQS